MIIANDLTKMFSGFCAVNNCSLKIKKGEFIAITGESGSGKSTLLSLLSGLDTPTSGTVELDGKSLLDFSEKERNELRNKKIGFVFQQFYLEPEYTVFENIEMPLIISGESKKARKERVLAVAENLGLSDKLAQKSKLLSGGEMQRCSIGRAVINNPQIIFADEPCGNLDTKNSTVVMDIFSELNRNGKTIVLVTHNLSDANRADRIIELKDGMIESERFNQHPIA